MANSTCSVDGCDRDVLIKSRGLCRMHYKRYMKTGDVGGVESLRQKDRICAVVGCGIGALARGLCSKHYQRLASGDVEGVRPYEMSVEERFWSSVDMAGPDECWLWKGRVGDGGYARFSLTHTTSILVHRYAYELLVGPIPDGKQLDHVKARGCSHRHCVNPGHLEPVTALENLHRSDITWATINARKTHCAAGHPFDEANTYYPPRGGRRCRACSRAENRRRRAN